MQHSGGPRVMWGFCAKCPQWGFCGSTVAPLPLPLLPAVVAAVPAPRGWPGVEGQKGPPPPPPDPAAAAGAPRCIGSAAHATALEPDDLFHLVTAGIGSKCQSPHVAQFCLQEGPKTLTSAGSGLWWSPHQHTLCHIPLQMAPQSWVVALPLSFKSEQGEPAATPSTAAVRRSHTLGVTPHAPAMRCVCARHPKSCMACAQLFQGSQPMGWMHCSHSCAHATTCCCHHCGCCQCQCHY